MSKVNTKNSIDWQSLSKPERLQLLQKLDTKIPDSYKTNTIKEELVLQYVSVFEKQFNELFPDRNKLVLAVKNEYGVKVS